MNKNNIFITIKKEMRSIFRDKRTIMMILGFPLIIAVMIFLYGSMEDMMMGTEETKYNIGINYEANEIEKELMQELSLVPKKYQTKKELEEAYEKDKIDSYVIYNEQENKYTIYIDDSDVLETSIASYIATYLESYNKYLGDIELYKNNLSPEIIYNNFQVETKSITGEEMSESAMMLKMIMGIAFTYIIVSISLATINMATTAIATEKEHGTLETILTLPITTTELLLGKYLATVLIGLISSISGFVITILSITISSNYYDIYKDFTMSPSVVIFGILTCLVASMVIAGLAITVTSSSKSYKEAQAAGQALEIMSMIPMFVQILNVKSTLVFYLVPILSHSTILMDLYSGNINYTNLLITIINKNNTQIV
jgi:sodium transport system permease protein